MRLVKIILIVLATLVVAIAGLVYYLSTPASAEDLKPTANLKIWAGEVLVNDQPATDGQELKSGDRIFTRAGARAELDFFDNSVSMLYENTDLVLDELSVNEGDWFLQKVKIKLQSGRIWSRIIKLMDKQAEFSVAGSNTVATVRGTGFDFQITAVGQEIVSVINHQVGIKVFKEDKIIDEEVLPENKQIIVTPEDLVAGQKKGFEVLDIPQTEKNSQWYLDNTKLERQFLEKIRDKIDQKQKARLGPIAPGSKIYPLQIWSEKIRLALSSKEIRSVLDEVYRLRRVAEWYSQSINRQEEVLRLDQSSRELEQLWAVLNQLESLKIQPADESSGDKVNANQAEKNNSEPKVIGPLIESPPASGSQTAGENINSNTNTEPIVEPPVSDGGTPADDQSPSAPAGETDNPPSAPVVERLTITPSQITVVRGTMVNFLATAVFSDGTQKELTSEAQWEIIGNPEVVGVIDQSGVLATAIAGNSTITATYGGLTATSAVSVYARGGKVSSPTGGQ